MKIRTATLNDLDALAAVEAECFPAAEAATKKDFENRLAYYADHFWLMFDENDKLIHYYAKFGFVNEGVSQSVHGNVVWYQMRLTF